MKASLTNSPNSPTLKANVTRIVLPKMTVTLKNKTPLVVPNRVRRAAGFKPGDRVEFKVSHGAVTILPKLAATQHPFDTLTPAEAKIVRRGEAQLKRGKSKPWGDVKHALAR
jgi:bifunctional DNA-binding transcriptional regulator/antitoxin component of YhaV-PrlF toxin-antitoxin module